MAVTLLFITGCGSTRPKNAKVDIFPIIKASCKVTDSDAGWRKEESGKALLFISWNNQQEFDADGNKISYRDEFSFWPLLHCYATKETGEDKRKDTGRILIFRYDSDEPWKLPKEVAKKAAGWAVKQKVF